MSVIRQNSAAQSCAICGRETLRAFTVCRFCSDLCEHSCPQCGFAYVGDGERMCAVCEEEQRRSVRMVYHAEPDRRRAPSVLGWAYLIAWDAILTALFWLFLRGVQ